MLMIYNYENYTNTNLSYNLAKYDKVIPATRSIIAMADVATKEDYLKWLGRWKATVKALEELIRAIKKARKPSEIPNTKLYTESFTGWHLPKSEKERFAAMTEDLRIMWFIGWREAALRDLRTAASELYRARRNMKLAAAMSRQNSKA